MPARSLRFTIAGSLFLLLNLASGSTTASADAFVHQDGEFAEADWTMHVFYEEGNGGTTTAWHQDAGGNPDALRMVRITVNDAPPYSGIGAFHRYVPVVYDPASSGAISSIDYEEDAKMFLDGGEGQATGPAVRQAGVVYYHFVDGTWHFDWRHKQAFGLQAGDFRNSPYGNQHPNFSASAPPLEIGFYRANSTYSGGYTIEAGIDNWSFTINTGQPTAAVATSWGRVRSLYR